MVAPVDRVVEQGGFKLCHGVAHGGAAGGAGLHAVGQVHQLCHHRVIQQGTKYHQPVQTGIPFTKVHK